MASEEYYEIGCLTPVGIKGYNEVISGEVNKEGIVKKGFNAYVNELNTRLKTDTTYDGIFFKKLKPLYQQVLFPREKAFTIETLNSDDDVRTCLREVFSIASKKNIFDAISYLKNSDPADVVVNGKSIHTLSHMLSGNHNTNILKIQTAAEISLSEKLDAVNKKIKDANKDEKKLLTKEKKNIKKELDNISKYVANSDYTFKELREITGDDYFTTYVTKLLDVYATVSSVMQDISNSDIFEDGNLRGYHKDKMMIKNYVDTLTTLSRTLSLVLIDSKKGSPIFYNEFTDKTQFISNAKQAVKLITAYMVRKTADMAEEYPICLGSPSLFAPRWWNESIEDGLECKLSGGYETIINMDGKYYFTVSGTGQKPIKFEYAEDGEEYYEVFNQKTAQDASKIFPKVLFKENTEPFFNDNPTALECEVNVGSKKITITREVYRIYKDKLFSVEAKKAGNISEKQFAHNLSLIIDVYKQFAEAFPHYRRFTFTFKDSAEYKDLGEFYADANVCMVCPRWEHIKKSQIDALIESGQMYAFLITNRNMYKDDNVKTSYAETFLELMSHDNFESGQLRINSKPQITFRPQCIPKKISHPKGSTLVNKKDKNGKLIPAHIYKELYAYLNGNLEKKCLSLDAIAYLEKDLVGYHKAEYDIARDLRYMEDKYFISISYVQNAKVSARNYNNISRETEAFMEDGYRTLSVARGTKDLIYYTLFDKDHTIMEQASLNKIGDVDFYEKLSALSRERNEGKADTWNYSVTVKNYKEWYLNAAIGKIIDIAVRNEAVIVIEDINDSFKDKMSCIDNQVFKTFENKLEARLMDYRKKHTREGIGSLTNPLQLAGSFTGGLQNGILFKLNGAYTSNVTDDGFVNVFDISRVTSQEQKLDFVKKFKYIKYDESLKLFIMTFDYRKFATKRTAGKDEWTLYIGKSQTVFNRELKANEFIEFPAKEVADLLLENAHLDGNIVDADLSKREASLLYDLFVNTLRNRVVKECAKNPFEYVTNLTSEFDTMDGVCESKCKALAKKLWYTIETRNTEEKIDYTEGWLRKLAE